MKPADVQAEDFFIPGIHEGLYLFDQGEWVWKPQPPARIHGFSLSNFPDQEIAGNRLMKKFHASGNFKSAIEFRNHLALVENLPIRNGMFFIKFALNNSQAKPGPGSLTSSSAIFSRNWSAA